MIDPYREGKSLSVGREARVQIKLREAKYDLQATLRWEVDERGTLAAFFEEAFPESLKPKLGA